jgi:hypothetical protein
LLAKTISTRSMRRARLRRFTACATSGGVPRHGTT